MAVLLSARGGVVHTEAGGLDAASDLEVSSVERASLAELVGVQSLSRQAAAATGGGDRIAITDAFALLTNASGRQTPQTKPGRAAADAARRTGPAVARMNSVPQDELLGAAADRPQQAVAPSAGLGGTSQAPAPLLAAQPHAVDGRSPRAWAPAPAAAAAFPTARPKLNDAIKALDVDGNGYLGYQEIKRAFEAIVKQAGGDVGDTGDFERITVQYPPPDKKELSQTLRRRLHADGRHFVRWAMEAQLTATPRGLQPPSSLLAAATVTASATAASEHPHRSTAGEGAEVIAVDAELAAGAARRAAAAERGADDAQDAVARAAAEEAKALRHAEAAVHLAAEARAAQAREPDALPADFFTSTAAGAPVVATAHQSAVSPVTPALSPTVARLSPPGVADATAAAAIGLAAPPSERASAKSEHGTTSPPGKQTASLGALAVRAAAPAAAAAAEPPAVTPNGLPDASAAAADTVAEEATSAPTFAPTAAHGRVSDAGNTTADVETVAQTGAPAGDGGSTSTEAMVPLLAASPLGNEDEHAVELEMSEGVRQRRRARLRRLLSLATLVAVLVPVGLPLLWIFTKSAAGIAVGRAATDGPGVLEASVCDTVVDNWPGFAMHNIFGFWLLIWYGLIITKLQE